MLLPKFFFHFQWLWLSYFLPAICGHLQGYLQLLSPVVAKQRVQCRAVGLQVLDVTDKNKIITKSIALSPTLNSAFYEDESDSLEFDGFQTFFLSSSTDAIQGWHSSRTNLLRWTDSNRSKIGPRSPPVQQHCRFQDHMYYHFKLSHKFPSRHCTPPNKHQFWTCGWMWTRCTAKTSGTILI